MIECKQRLRQFLPIGLLSLSLLIFFSNILFLGESLFGSDYVLYFHPVKNFTRDYVCTHGSFPFWNPYLFSGTPFIANIQASMFYPLGFLFYLMPAEHAYLYTIMIHCFLGSAFMYIFIRSFSINRTGAFFAAFIFTYNGFFMAHLYAGHLTFVQNYIWIPLILYYVNKFINTKNLRYAVVAGLFLGIQILGGFPQLAFYTILAVLSFSLFHIGINLKTRHIKDSARIGIGIVIVICAGFALAAIQILPTLEFTNLSTRAGGVDYDFATYDSLHPKNLLSFLIPDIFGNVVDKTYWLSHEDWHFWETCGYVGILPLLLIFVSPRKGAACYLRIFCIGIMVLSLFIAMGKYNPLYPLIYKLPGFNSFRIPAQILFLYVFALAVASGIGLNAMKDSDWRVGRGFAILLVAIGLFLLFLVISIHYFPFKFFFYLFKNFAEASVEHLDITRVYDRVKSAVDRSAMIFGVLALLFFMIRKKEISRNVINAMIIVAAMTDLGLFSSQFVTSYDFVVNSDKQRLVEQFSRQIPQGRIVTQNSFFDPNDGLLYRFPSVQGYDPLILKRYATYVQTSQGLLPNRHVVNLSALIKAPDAKLLKALNLTTVVQEEAVESIEPLLPYAMLVNKAVVKPSEKVLRFMISEDFDPREMVVLESEYEIPIIYRNQGESFKASCSVITRANENIRINTSANLPGYLILNEIFYPGWEATVDGKKAPLYQGNYLLCVVPLKQGRHEVHLSFVSWSFRIGAAISALTFICCMWVIAQSSRHKISSLLFLSGNRKTSVRGDICLSE